MTLRIYCKDVHLYVFSPLLRVDAVGYVHRLHLCPLIPISLHLFLKQVEATDPFTPALSLFQLGSILAWGSSLRS